MGWKKLYLTSSATGSPFPTSSRLLNETPNASEVQLGPGEFDSGLPGVADAGQWNPNSAIGDTTAAAEIDNTGASLGTTRQGWLWDQDLTGKVLAADRAWTFQLRLRANQGSGTLAQICARVTIVTGSAGAYTTVKNLFTTSVTGGSPTAGQAGWRDQNEARITVTSTAANFTVTVGGSGTVLGHTFASGERILVELGFCDADSTTDRTWRLDFNTSDSFVRTAPFEFDRVTETDTAQAVAWAPKRRLVGQVTETDTIIPLVKRITVGQVVETETARRIALPYPTYFGSASTPADNGGSATDPTVVTPLASMVAGDLVAMVAQLRLDSVTPAISEAGGQSWSSLTVFQAAGTVGSFRIFWCRFNGTWSADPSVSFGSTSRANTVVMHVIRPVVGSHGWGVNVAQATGNSSVLSTTQTIAGQTTTQPDAVTLACWFAAEDAVAAPNGVTPPEWDLIGSPQYRNYNGSQHQVAIFALQFSPDPGATGNVVITTAAQTNFRATLIVSFFEKIPITVAVGQATNTNTAQALTARKTRAVTQSTESELAQPLARRIAVAQASESDSAQPLAKRILVGQTLEADLAQEVTEPAGHTVTVNQVTETDAAQTTTARKTTAIGQPSETDTAGAVTWPMRRLVAQALETELAQAVTAGGGWTIEVGQTAETDAAHVLTARKTQLLAAAAETDAALAVSHPLVALLAQCLEIDLAQGLETITLRAFPGEGTHAEGLTATAAIPAFSTKTGVERA